MIDVGRLQALRAVATYGTVTAAAAALHCTPSAVSQHLGKLERETGASLTQRDGRRLRLTEAGRLLVEHAGRVLAAVEQAEAALAAHQATVSGRITVSSFPTACRGLLPQTLRWLAAEHPLLRPMLIEADRETSLDGLQRGAVDVAVVDEWPELEVRVPAGVAHAELGQDVGDLMVPAEHPLALSAGPVRLTDLVEERWIGAQAGTVCSEWLRRMVPQVEPAIRVNEFATQLTFVAAGLGIAFVPRLARRSVPPGVLVRPVTPVASRRVIVAWRDAAATRPAIGAVVTALRDAWEHRSLDVD
jgi:DNA-binding transcriptional LysR family regulator